MEDADDLRIYILKTSRCFVSMPIQANVPIPQTPADFHLDSLMELYESAEDFDDPIGGDEKVILRFLALSTMNPVMNRRRTAFQIVSCKSVGTLQTNYARGLAISMRLRKCG